MLLILLMLSKISLTFPASVSSCSTVYGKYYATSPIRAYRWATKRRHCRSIGDDKFSFYCESLKAWTTMLCGFETSTINHLIVVNNMMGRSSRMSSVCRIPKFVMTRFAFTQLPCYRETSIIMFVDVTLKT